MSNNARSTDDRRSPLNPVIVARRFFASTTIFARPCSLSLNRTEDRDTGRSGSITLDDKVAPFDGTVAPLDDTVEPLDDTRATLDDMAAPLDDTVAPFDDTAAPFDDTKATAISPDANHKTETNGCTGVTTCRGYKIT
ncbi:hypothetical protein DPMN_122657 [Dreissena polymorpha]|uniref:Uncharacterized protein n=1 Tax=Dreissena polymorpha TaxID=45954 RepID=A0A9D4JUE2_DREPO|nr:hypothetical protein DPMN_122657 [Dreissena polymorpha]